MTEEQKALFCDRYCFYNVTCNDRIHDLHKYAISSEDLKNLEQYKLQQELLMSDICEKCPLNEV